MASSPLVRESVRFAGVASEAVRVHAAPGRPRLLFLHGFSDSADGWRRVQRRLADAGVGSLAVDQPSHGAADALDDDRPAIEQFVAFAADAARATDDGRPVIVVGNSLGGAHALLLAQHHPELVAGVVAISPAAFDHPRWFGVMDRMPEGGSGDLPWWAPPERVRRTIAAPAMRAVAFGKPWRAPAGFLRQWQRSWQDPERRSAMRAVIPRFRDEYLAGSPFDLSAITCPVLALWGTQDRLVLISSREALEAGIADLDFQALPGVGHMPQLEVPGRTTKHLLGFVDRLDPTQRRASA